jgi:hypothetical protein
MPDPVTGVLAASAIAGAGANIFGAQSAADAQREAAAAGSKAIADQQAKGLATQKSYYDQGAAALQPIADTGSAVYKDLVSRLPDLTAPIVMDQATLEKTPGYEWTQAQGVRGVDLSSVSRGLSGAQAKAAATFATNLADTTYKTQFDIANTNKTNAFNRLLQTASVGTDAAKSIAGNATAAADVATGQNVSNALTRTAGAYAAAPSNNPFGNYGTAGMYGNPAVANYNRGNPIY